MISLDCDVALIRSEAFEVRPKRAFGISGKGVNRIWECLIKFRIVANVEDEGGCSNRTPQLYPGYRGHEHSC